MSSPSSRASPSRSSRQRQRSVAGHRPPGTGTAPVAYAPGPVMQRDPSRSYSRASYQPRSYAQPLGRRSIFRVA